MLRSHTCGELRASHAGKRVTLCGWVLSRRDHGGLLFLDLRDRFGITQVVVEPDAPSAAKDEANRARLEWVVRASGVVRVRPGATTNKERATGEVEVVVDEFTVLNTSEPLPIAVAGPERSSEEMELKYRYLQVRRTELNQALVTRAKTNQLIRAHMIEHGFTEVETPCLLKSTPEGARDYLVPSRVHPGSFYALLQSPQLLKQLLMIGGMDRYWQIVRCFRDENLRADRQPEFTQLDIEMSFVREEDVQEVAESLVHRLLREVAGVDASRPFPKLTFAQAMERYGSDKPDLRFDLPIHDVSAALANCAFGVFSGAVKDGGVVRVVAVPSKHALTRKDLDALPAVVADRGAKGVAWCRVELAAGDTFEEKLDNVFSTNPPPPPWTGPVAKHLTPAEKDALVKATGVDAGGVLLFLAGPRTVAVPASGDLRLHLGKHFGLQQSGDFKPLWVTGFPLVEWNPDEKRWDSVHHPFTAPVAEDVALIESDPGKVRSHGYDLVLNGFEILGGSIRIHDAKLQRRVLRLIGMDDATIDARFAFLLEALAYGAPPHGGFAMGMDRVIAVLMGLTNIRDVIAFPKTTSASDLMTGAPSAVDAKQLAELGIRLA
jgi:aspartyl-tRNA synthetase